MGFFNEKNMRFIMFSLLKSDEIRLMKSKNNLPPPRIAPQPSKCLQRGEYQTLARSFSSSCAMSQCSHHHQKITFRYKTSIFQLFQQPPLVALSDGFYSYIK